MTPKTKMDCFVSNCEPGADDFSSGKGVGGIKESRSGGGGRANAPLGGGGGGAAGLEIETPVCIGGNY